MPRLIDSDALNEFLKGSFQTENIRSDDNDEYFFQKGWNDAIRFIMTSIEKKLTIEAEPVRHGRWISLTDCSNAGVYCSVCHKKVYKEDYAWCNRKNKLRSNYCPNCGCKMRGVE